MGRRHLSLLLLLVALAVAASAAAAGTIPWRVASHGAAVGVSPETAPFAVVATGVPAAARIAARVPRAAGSTVRRVNFHTSVLVGVFGPFGCKDARVRVSRVVERGRVLIVHLVVKPLPPGVVECLAIFTTYRLLVVPRKSLSGLPTSARVTVAGA